MFLEGAAGSISYPEDGGRRYLRNVSAHVPNYALASESRGYVSIAGALGYSVIKV
jgi:hypothetical protein